jgi:replicative DNA helicase
MSDQAFIAPSLDLPGVDEDELPFREAPNNIEAEQALLGAILVNNAAFDRVSAFLMPEHFFEPVHGRIFEALVKIIGMGKLASPVTLKTYFEHDESLADIGGAQYLVRLAASATAVINAEDYARTVYDLATRRNLILIGEDLVNTAYDAPPDLLPSDQIEDAEQRLYDLAEKGKYGGDFQTFSRALTDAIDMAGAAYERDGGLSGISCGLSSIDEKMGGLQASDLIILAGRPSMGKTALATNIAFHVARNYRAETQPDGSTKTLDGAVVGFFSLEMSAEQLATRIIAEQAAVSSGKIRRGKITETEFNKLVSVSQELQSLPLYIDETGGITIAQLAARARKLKRQRNLGLIIIDYLQLLSGSARKASDGRVQEVSEITQRLKALAKELDVPIIALSQLSRQVEARDDKRPQLADLRESGSIEQDADVVAFVFREEYYVERRMPALNTPEFFEWQDEMSRVEGIAEFIIGKQRHGPTGKIELHFQADVTRFSDLAPSSHMPERFE